MAVPDLKDAIEHLQRKDLDAAIAALERKIEELPAHLTAHVLLAKSFESKHRWADALTCWENVCFLMPNSPVGQEGKARVLRRMNRTDEAEDAAPSPGATPSVRPDPDASPDEDDGADAPTTPSEAASELERLRRQAEAEAREGGARPELAEAAGDASDAGDEEASPATPEERVDQFDEDDDLDRLIQELESARIDPQPDMEEVPAPDLDHDVDDLVSETLARIHEAQDQYRKAAQIYVKLASQEPDRARDHLEKAAEMRKRAESKAQEED